MLGEFALRSSVAQAAECLKTPRYAASNRSSAQQIV
jgi:hypothetical protein